MAAACDAGEPYAPCGKPAQHACHDQGVLDRRAQWVCLFACIGQSSRFRHCLLQEETGDEERKTDAG